LLPKKSFVKIDTAREMPVTASMDWMIRSVLECIKQLMNRGGDTAEQYFVLILDEVFFILNMSLRGAFFATKQSPNKSGDCFVGESALLAMT